MLQTSIVVAKVIEGSPADKLSINPDWKPNLYRLVIIVCRTSMIPFQLSMLKYI